MGGKLGEGCVIKAWVRQLERELSVKLKSVLRPSGKSSEKRALNLTLWQVSGGVSKSNSSKSVEWEPDAVKE